MSDFYLWVKALHVISMVAWMAGLFYLPRLFVYHSGAVIGDKTSETFKIMEGKLLRIIMRPAAIIVLASGIFMIVTGNLIPMDVWLQVKLVAVVGMFGFHGFLEATAASFLGDKRPHSEKFFRLMNEAPTLLLAVIVVMAIVKPFQ